MSESSKTGDKDKRFKGREKLQSLLRKRALIVSNAVNKKKALSEIINEQILNGTEKKYTLFYCPPGKHSEYLSLIANLGIRAREFVYDVSESQRASILETFSSGDIEAIVAIKCLDEGVDVPVTRTAYILASTTNPREFIQRRGRILRKYDGKREAIIHDFVVIPPQDDEFMGKKIEYKKSILKREMPRFAEFAISAKNHFESREKVWHVLDKYNLLHLLDLKPWEIYKESNEMIWEST